jgi:hypothetical protein
LSISSRPEASASSFFGIRLRCHPRRLGCRLRLRLVLLVLRQPVLRVEADGPSVAWVRQRQVEQVAHEVAEGLLLVQLSIAAHNLRPLALELGHDGGPTVDARLVGQLAQHRLAIARRHDLE